MQHPPRTDLARKVLVVDHDAETRRWLASVLEPAGLEPVLAADAHEARAALDAHRPGLLLLEAELPGASGLELLRDLRDAPETADLPVVVLTSLEGDDQITHAFEAGADDFLRKPLRAPELLARIRSQLRLRQSVEELARKERDALVMVELTQALASSLDFRDILYTVVRRIAEVVQVARVSIVLAPEPDEGDVGYVVVASDDAHLSNLKLDLTKYPEIQQVLRTREPLTINDVHTHPILDGVRSDVKEPPSSAR